MKEPIYCVYAGCNYPQGDCNGICLEREQKLAGKFPMPQGIRFVPDPAPDMVNSPTHYTSHPSGVECIEVTEHYNFCVGNAIKYLWRAGLKGSGAKGVEDLKKAAWYINREIDRLGPNGEGLLQDPVQGQTK